MAVSAVPDIAGLNLPGPTGSLPETIDSEFSPVQIQINTDHHIDAGPELRSSVEATVSGTLGRFGERLTRVEVHLTDVNAQKGGRDIRCVMEARAAGFKPVMVDELARDVDMAVRGAASKLERALETRFERIGRR